MYEVWVKRRGGYLPQCWFFESADAVAFARAMRRRGTRCRVRYNATCAMPGWKPPSEELRRARKSRL